MIKTLIIGETSKVAQSICRIAKERSATHLFHFMSLRTSADNHDEILRKLKEAELIVYLVGDPRTSILPEELYEYIHSNVEILSCFLKEYEKVLKHKKFVYFSSAKVYNLFPKSCRYNEKLDFSESNYHDVIVDAARFGARSMHKELYSLLKEMKPLPNSTNYQPFYEIIKAVCEIIVREKISNAYIIRASYLFGAEEPGNYIYQLVCSAVCGKPALINHSGKDFVPYKVLYDLLEAISAEENEKAVAIINLCTGNLILESELIEYVKIFNRICGVQSAIKDDGHISINCVAESENLKSYLGADCISNQVFHDEIRRIFYVLYLELVHNYKIKAEFIGGSYARVYRVTGRDGNEYAAKIALGNGANNGNNKLLNEIRHIKSMQQYLQRIKYRMVTPKVTTVRQEGEFSFFTTEYIYGETFNEVQKNGYTATKLFLTALIEVLCEIYSSHSKAIYQDMIGTNNGRVKDRLFDVYRVCNMRKMDAFSHVFTYDKLVVNGEELKNPFLLLSELAGQNKELFSNRLGPCISGDPIMDNCICTKEGMSIIDPRGEDLLYIDGVPYFDPLYDLGKILFYFLGWKLVREEAYELEISDSSFKDKTVISMNFCRGEQQELFKKIANSCKEIFCSYSRILNPEVASDMFSAKILLYAGYHFLADTYPRIVGKGNQLSQCIAEYTLGTIIINRVYNFFEGSTDYISYDALLGGI